MVYALPFIFIGIAAEAAKSAKESRDATSAAQSVDDFGMLQGGISTDVQIAPDSTEEVSTMLGLDVPDIALKQQLPSSSPLQPFAERIVGGENTIMKMNPDELLSNQIVLAELAEDVSATGRSIGDNTKKQLETFKTLLNTMADDIGTAHTDDQQLIYDDHKAVIQCNVTFGTSTIENDMAEDDWKSSESNHSKCRRTQVTHEVTKRDECDDLTDFQKRLERVVAVPATSTFPTTSMLKLNNDTFREYFDDAKKKIDDEQELWQKKALACSVASEDFEENKASCALLQQQFEKDFCGWRNAAYHNCYDLHDCQDTNAATFASTIDSTKEREQVRKQHWESIKGMNCFLDVITGSEKNITKCKKMVVDTSMLNLAYPVYEKVFVECSLPTVEPHPGSSTWTDRYNKTLVQKEESTCEVIPAHVLEYTSCEPISDCSGHGTTSDTDKTNGCTCSCTDDYSGGDCSKPPECDATEDCSAHGTTHDMDSTDGCVCTCHGGYTGDDCSIPPQCQAETHCSGHSTLDKDATDGCKCECSSGWSGEDCSVPPPKKCLKKVKQSSYTSIGRGSVGCLEMQQGGVPQGTFGDVPCALRDSASGVSGRDACRDKCYQEPDCFHFAAGYYSGRWNCLWLKQFSQHLDNNGRLELDWAPWYSFKLIHHTEEVDC